MDKGSSSKKRFSFGRLPDGPHHLEPLRRHAKILIRVLAQGILSATEPRGFQTKFLTRSQLMFTFGAEKPRSQEFKLLLLLTQFPNHRLSGTSASSLLTQ